MIVCPSCGQENPDGFRLCGMCGEALGADALPPREERKVVTVLFCDLVGSTARAESADPEDVRALLSAYHERVRSELERFGGTVEKFIGDAVMALFGAPTAHEDDPERAVRAALAIREWAQEDGELQVRIGITTGEALVSLGARPGSGEGMASGDVVNTAARLQTAAPVNGILADETTCRAASQVVEFGESEPIAAKGKSQPVAARLVVAARSRLGVDVRQHGAAPLVGRERELELLIATLTRVREERSPQLLTLVGAPGIGKSRLVFELLQNVERESELVTWRQGRSLPYGEGVSFWALGEMVKAQAGILESDSPGEVEGKLRRSLEAALSDVTEADWVERHLRPLVGLAASGEGSADRHEEAFAAWRKFLEALAERRPLVLVFEDLHWADDGLLDFVDHLVDWATGVPILVLCTARPELLDRRPGWGGGKLNTSMQAVSPLAERDTARLIADVLAQAVLPAETQAALLERAGGNPLYAEQFARLYVERGSADDLPLPETVQGIVGARLDALPADEKEVLQDACVIGKVFWTGALGSELDRARRLLHGLERKGFVRRERRASVEGQEEYAFSHPVVREVAYGQIPRAVRADKHRRVAEWIESLGRTGDHAEMLAHHYSHTLELKRAAGQETAALHDRARRAFNEAGDRARALNAFASASHFYAAALELWPEDDAERAPLLLACGQALRFARNGGEEMMLGARDAFLAAGEAERAAEAEAALGELFWERGEPRPASEHLQRAAALVENLEPSRSKAYVLAGCSRLWTFVGREREALELGRDAVRMAEELGLDDLRAHALNNVGVARVRLGDPGGVADLELSIEVARVGSNAAETLRALWNLAVVVGGTIGDTKRGEALAREGLETAVRFGSAHWEGTFSRYLAETAYFAGRWDEALLPVAESQKTGAGGTWHLGMIALARGRSSDAVAHAAAELETARHDRAGDLETLASVLGLCARLLIAAGRRAEAETVADELVEVLTSSRGELGSLGEGWLLIAFPLEELGRGADMLAAIERAFPSPFTEFARYCAEGDLLGAAEVCARIGARPDEAYARLRAAEKLVTAGRRAEADEQLQKSLAFWRSVRATFYIREAETLLAESA
jgi:class 3 adenylate cyclase/tetratricopeptide (TPR) repeat protein